MPIVHNINAKSHTSGFDAVTFVGSMVSLKVTITACFNVRLRFFLLKSGGGGYKFLSARVKFLSFD